MKRGKMKRMLESHSECETKCHYNNACGGGIYFFGFIGSLVYYLQQSTTFWEGVLGVLKAMVWPAFLVYKLLTFQFD
jgi:hypothetical protein